MPFMLEDDTASMVGGRIDQDNFGLTRTALRRAVRLSDDQKAALSTLRLNIDEFKKHKLINIPPDFIGTPSGMPFISSALRDEIERLEPGVHCFFLTTVVWEKTQEPVGSYFVLSVTQQIDCYDFEKTKWLSTINDGWGREAAEAANYRLPGGHKNRVLRGDAIQGRHLWRAAYPEDGTKQMFCSKELAHFINARKRSCLRTLPFSVS